ncbi:MAG TPA: helix-turn-helix domain-containing protein [Tepidisphaeraceae bacterium]|jgi:AraC-like DNA-binding protein|nr:helix-turn-helix domain-containing protein [Tepidisphaeraceae bacterium]
MRVKLPIPSGDVGFVQEAWARSLKPWKGPPHRHAELELNLVCSGHAVYLVRSRQPKGRQQSLGSNRINIAADNILWLFPSQEHMLVECSSDFHMLIAVFRPALVDSVRQMDRQLNPLGSQSGSSSPARIVTKAVRAQLQPLMSSLTTGGTVDHATTAVERDWGMRWLLASAWRAYEAASDAPVMADVHPAVERAAFLLRDDPGQFDLALLARRAGVSPAWLSRLFQRQLGMSVTEFRNRQRISRYLAAHRSGKGQTLTAAAFAAGFNSYPQFYRVFRSFTGLSPVEYDSQNRTSYV